VDWKYRVFVPKEALEPFTLLPFEDRQFRCPADSAKALTETFGPNYMTPPPPEKRVSYHESKAYWR
jgi:phosphorylcholine metabolism protein LicD